MFFPKMQTKERSGHGEKTQTDSPASTKSTSWKDYNFSINYNVDGKAGWAKSTFRNATTATGYKASCSSGGI